MGKVLANGNVFKHWFRRAGEMPLLLCLFVVLLAAWDLGVPTCPVRLLTGRPCPTCGTTRSVVAIISGDFGHAWELNPIGFVVVLAFAKRLGELFGPLPVRQLLGHERTNVTMLILFLTIGTAKFAGYF